MGLSVIKKWMMITKDTYSPTIRTRFHSIQVPLLHVNCTTTLFQMEHLLHTTHFCTWFTWDIIASIKFCTRILFFLIQYKKHQSLFLCHSQSPSIDLNSANKTTIGQQCTHSCWDTQLTQRTPSISGLISISHVSTKGHSECGIPKGSHRKIKRLPSTFDYCD